MASFLRAATVRAQPSLARVSRSSLLTQAHRHTPHPTLSRRKYAASAHGDHGHADRPQGTYDQGEQVAAFTSFLVFGGIMTYLLWKPGNLPGHSIYKLDAVNPLDKTNATASGSLDAANEATESPADQTTTPDEAPEAKPAVTGTGADEVTNAVEIVRPLGTFYKYVIIGGGTAAFHALKAIKQTDPQADVLVIGAEPLPPYSRPQLSKEMWGSKQRKALKFDNWAGDETSVFYKDASAYAVVHADPTAAPEGDHLVFKTPADRRKPLLLLKHRATALDVDKAQVTLDSGRVIQYGKVLLATGGTPRRLAATIDLPDHLRPHVTTFRTLEDFQRLDALTDTRKHVVIVGGGLLGSELACALTAKFKAVGRDGGHVTQVCRSEDGVLADVLPTYLVRWTTDQLRDYGVEVLKRKDVVSITEAATFKEGSAPQLAIEFKDGAVVEADHLVQAVGIEPNVELARAAGLEIDPVHGGIVVNAELEARRNVFVAGDAASYYDMLLGRRREEHYDHAAQTGHLAGKNMCGETSPYVYQPAFWSDLGPKISFDSVGKVDPKLPTASVWAQDSPIGPTEGEAVAAGTASAPTTTTTTMAQTTAAATQSGPTRYEHGLVYYLDNNKIVGMVTWNLPGRVELARQVVLRGEFQYKHIQGLTRMFNIHRLDMKPEAKEVKEVEGQ
ncbi:hypothetical protein IWQ60_000212 [Tieghemiomyces parasiticus]|uniref:FAD/NAD(P)-binding domain-containing protein n=1 Tax=Tieghemiomyces parasiticus TaxID=78921 RepID=A0A9W8AJ97_9FUNG|nr:hypothetical protein IWQ60_000212 [Tieghemiomyces parasiticus]